MPTRRKEATLNQLRAWLQASEAVVLTDYRGLTVKELDELRRRLRQAGVEYHVAKNTLLRLAAQQLDRSAIVPMLEGPTAIAFSPTSETAAAKALLEYIRSTRTVLKIKGGILDRQALTAEQVEALAALPPRPELVGKVLGGLKAPLYGLAGVLQANIRQLVSVLDQRRSQLATAPAGEAAGVA